jgi:IS1 family transposase
MNQLTTSKRVNVLSALIEGCSIRSTVRMTGAAKNTVTKFVVDLGTASAGYLHDNIHNVTAKRIQCDEIWSFVGMKEKQVPAERKGERGIGDVWTWTAMDADTKLLISYLIGARDAVHASHFMADVASRLTHRVQLTTDGHKPYLEAIEGAFGGAIDYAMLIKHYGNMPGNTAEVRYSPGECVGCEKRAISGNPDPDHISTSFAERQNLTMRMRMRRFTRLTNAFSKKIENHEHAISIYAMHYNFVRRHQTLRATPAQVAGIDGHMWSLEEMVGLLD